MFGNIRKCTALVLAVIMAGSCSDISHGSPPAPQIPQTSAVPVNAEISVPDEEFGINIDEDDEPAVTETTMLTDASASETVGSDAAASSSADTQPAVTVSSFETTASSTAPVTSKTTKAAVPDTDPPSEARFRKRLAKICEKYGVYGMSVALFKDGDIIHTENYGNADIELKIPATDNTRYRIASISKLISTIVIMQLCEEGLMSRDSYLTDVTGLPYDSSYGRVKLWHLLTHTAGLNDPAAYFTGMGARYSTAYVLKSAHTGAKPGTQYYYTNFGAGTMGSIIEVLTGEYFHDYMQKALFDPLGMDASYIIDLIKDKSSCAVIYDHDGEIFHVASWKRNKEYYESFGLGNSYLAAQCELIITASDLARIGTALAGDGTVKECGGKRILSEKAVKAMHESYFSTGEFDMGLNVRIYDGTLVPGRVIYGHPGNALGAINGLFYDREDKTGIVILDNRSSTAKNEKNGVYGVLDEIVKEAYADFFES